MGPIFIAACLKPLTLWILNLKPKARVLLKLTGLKTRVQSPRLQDVPFAQTLNLNPNSAVPAILNPTPQLLAGAVAN